MLIEELGTLLVVEQGSEDGVAVARPHVENALGHPPIDKERLSPCDWMRAHNGVREAGQIGRALRTASRRAPSVVKDVHRLPSGNPLSERGRQRLIGGIGVGEERSPA